MTFADTLIHLKTTNVSTSTIDRKYGYVFSSRQPTLRMTSCLNFYAQHNKEDK